MRHFIVLRLLALVAVLVMPMARADKSSASYDLFDADAMDPKIQAKIHEETKDFRSPEELDDWMRLKLQSTPKWREKFRTDLEDYRTPSGEAMSAATQRRLQSEYEAYILHPAFVPACREVTSNVSREWAALRPSPYKTGTFVEHMAVNNATMAAMNRHVHTEFIAFYRTRAPTARQPADTDADAVAEPPSGSMELTALVVVSETTELAPAAGTAVGLRRRQRRGLQRRDDTYNHDIAMAFLGTMVVAVGVIVPMLTVLMWSFAMAFLASTSGLLLLTTLVLPALGVALFIAATVAAIVAGIVALLYFLGGGPRHNKTHNFPLGGTPSTARPWIIRGPGILDSGEATAAPATSDSDEAAAAPASSDTDGSTPAPTTPATDGSTASPATRDPRDATASPATSDPGDATAGPSASDSGDATAGPPASDSGDATAGPPASDTGDATAAPA